MEEIKEGEYIRFGYGEIGIVKYYDGINIGIITQYGETEISSGVDKIAKRPIDLVEVGDYVNGKKIEAIIDGFLKSEGVAERVLCFETDFPIEKGLRCYHNCDIKTILTHEMYEQNCYKIGE